MVAAERLLTDGDHSMKEGLGLACMPGFIQQASEVAEAGRCLGMLGAERLLVDRQRALEGRPRPRKVTLGLKQAGEAVETELSRELGFSQNESQMDLARVQATVAARQFCKASLLRTRSVLRETRWR